MKLIKLLTYGNSQGTAILNKSYIMYRNGTKGKRGRKRWNSDFFLLFKSIKAFIHDDFDFLSIEANEAIMQRSPYWSPW